MNPRLTTALFSGLAGAAALNVIHETARRVRPEDAPRMDTLGRRAIASGMEAAGFDPPPEDRLQAMAFGGDVVSNTLYYSLAAMGRPSFAHGAALGAAAGVGAVVLSPLMWLGRRPAARTPQTAAMTVAWYLIGGLATAAAHHWIAGDPGGHARNASPTV